LLAVTRLLGERYYVTFDLWYEPSVVCLWRRCALPRKLNISGIFLHRQIA